MKICQRQRDTDMQGIKENKEGMRDSNGFPEPFPAYAPASIHAKFIRFQLQGSFLDHLDFSSSILPKRELVIVGFPLFSLLLCTLNLGQGLRHKKTFFGGEKVPSRSVLGHHFWASLPGRINFSLLFQKIL